MKKKYIISIFIILFLFLILTNYSINAGKITTEGSIQYKAKMYIDCPTVENCKDEMYLKGWIMTDDEESQIKVFINNEEITGLNIEREEREDVLRAIQGYGGIEKNPTPGFKTVINTSAYNDGIYEIKIQVISRNKELIEEKNRNFTIKKYEAKSYIDYPSSEIVKKKMNLSGWVMTEDKESQIKVFINDKEITGLNIEREAREDVIKAIQGYGGIEKNSTPGFKTVVDTSNYGDGIYELKIQIISRYGEIIEEKTRNFTIKKYEAKMYIDCPTVENCKDEMYLKGWIMTDDEESQIKVFINNEEITGLNIEREAREDVIKAIQRYGGIEKNPIPGFKTVVDTSNYEDGIYELKIQVLSREGVIIEEKKKSFEIREYIAKSYIDYPSSEIVKKKMNLSGWVMTEDKKSQIKVFINNKEITGLNIERETREDVIKAIQGYGGIEKNPTPGFKTAIDTSEYRDGIYELRIQIISDNRIIGQSKKSFVIKKYDAKVYLDYPITNQIYRSNTLLIKGWEMSEHPVSILKIRIDGIEIENVERVEREDVLNAITDFGGRVTNPKPGFYKVQDISNLSDGNHVISIEVYSELNELMGSKNVEITINREYMLGIDVSQHNGNIDWEKVRESGIDFAIIRCGYGRDRVSQDDSKFVRNISECERLRIPYGVYLYSYAGDGEGAKSEAEHALRLIRTTGANPTMGVWIDIEDADGYKVRNGISYNTSEIVANTFCSIINNNGYRAGIYASLYWYRDYLDSNSLLNYEKWVAQWNSRCTYEKNYVMWQYSSSGSVNGISGNVDMDKYYQ